MFTGVVTDIGEAVAIEERAAGLRRLRIACTYDPTSIAIGASSCGGALPSATPPRCCRRRRS
jgi:riboflavin synthase